MKAKILIVTLLFSSAIFGQKVVKSEIDSFTGQKKTTSNMQVIGRNFSTAIGLTVRTVNEKMFIDLGFTYTTKATIINRNHDIMFKISSGDIINLHVSDDNFRVLQQYLTLPLLIPAEFVDDFANTYIEAIRINTSDGYIDFKDFKDKNKLKVKNLFGLMKDELTK
jgi:hypothetical protein